jgi:hypothetical protein
VRTLSLDDRLVSKAIGKSGRSTEATPARKREENRA